MAMDIKAMAKLAGISDNELKGLSVKEQIKLISKKMTEEQSSIETEGAKTYISNADKPMTELKEMLENPFEIYVKKVAQKKTPTIVPVIGYNSFEEEVIVFFNGKVQSIKEDDLIGSTDELMSILNADKPPRKTTKKKK